MHSYVSDPFPLSDRVNLFLVDFLIFKVGPNNLSGHVYLFLVVLLIFKFSRNNFSDYVYLFRIVLVIFKVGRNNLSGQVYIFHVVRTCYTSTCQHKTTRPCKHYPNSRGSIDASVLSNCVVLYLMTSLILVFLSRKDVVEFDCIGS